MFIDSILKKIFNEHLNGINLNLKAGLDTLTNLEHVPNDLIVERDAFFEATKLASLVHDQTGASGAAALLWVHVAFCLCRRLLFKVQSDLGRSAFAFRVRSRLF
jgi:hypothetical protein